MPNFKCHLCGFGTLVRSNMKLTRDRKPYCRAENKCWEHMMSLYNLAMGFNPGAGLVLAILRMDPKKDVPRFRDAWFENSGKEMVLLTRTGGNNRAEYNEEHVRLLSHRLYLSNDDDTFDSTFCRYVYLVPEEFTAETTAFAAAMVVIGLGAHNNGPNAMARKLTEQKPPRATDEDKIMAAHCFKNLAEKVVASCGLPNSN
jgi:hypothetical protein